MVHGCVWVYKLLWMLSFTLFQPADLIKTLDKSGVTLKVFIYLFIFINHGVTALCAMINPSVKALNGTFSKWCYAVLLATPKNHWRAAIFCISMVGENNRGEKCFLCCRFTMECLLVGQTFHGDSSASACTVMIFWHHDYWAALSGTISRLVATLLMCLLVSSC